MKKKISKTPKSPEVHDLRPEYDFRGGVRGKHAKQYAEGSNVVILNPDVAEVFPDSESVNEALRALIPIVGRGPRRAIRKKSSA